MKKIIIGIFLLMPFVAKAQISPERTDSIKKALYYQKANYPASQYRDVYKNFMQDFYGPGHILNDKEAACGNLKRELNSVSYFDGPDYEPTGFQGNFYRVNLRLIADGTIPYMTYLDAFVESVSKITPPEPEVWIATWNQIDNVMDEIDWHFDNEDQDRRELAAQLSEGNFVVHHSDSYNENVNFHYRIISKDKFLEIILPLLK